MSALHALATELGVERTWHGVDGEDHAVTDDTLLAVCRALGAAVDRPEAAAGELARIRHEKFAAGVEPVTVAWDTDRPVLTLFRPLRARDEPFEIDVRDEDGRTLAWTRAECSVGRLETLTPGVVAMQVQLPRSLPFGRYDAIVSARGKGEGRASILVAPRRITNAALPRWGVFAPLYALHERAQTSTGDLGTFRRFAAWAADRGARVVGTLPILATFVGHDGEPCDPSPYAPVSRRFWNETYLDVHPHTGVAADSIEPSPGQYVDLPALAARKRALLEPLADRAAHDPALRTWVAGRPDVTEYARFRGKVEGGGDAAVRYHEYAQWCCERQLSDLANELRGRNQALYLDLPVGTHREGFDVHSEGTLFVRDASVGAPPDDFHAAGQNWGFPPVDPRVARGDGYRYLRSCVDAHLRIAGVLRIDHVMGLHRLWFVPSGARAFEGAYVRYAADEQWAAVCLVAARRDAVIVGENLGTVPEATDRALREHGALGMWVVEFETPPAAPTAPPRVDELACVETHDLPPFAAWWRDLDANRRAALVATLRQEGELPRDGRAEDEVDPQEVLGALYAWLGRSDAPIVLAGLEDLWLETEPQNRPGTPSEHNFNRRAAYGLDDLEGPDALLDAELLLARLARARRSVTS
jgi:4-alpha-glucanotransferase